MKSVLIAAAFSFVVFVAMSFTHPFGDPRAVSKEVAGTPLRDARIPEPAKAVLIQKCADCHSTETRWPIYARIAPGSWLIERDIMEARKAMNLSQWDLLTSEKQDVLTAKILSEARHGTMPPVQYRLIHWGTAITVADITALSTMSNTHSSEASVRGVGDPVNGKAVFEKRCTGCHALDSDREGPRLAGVFSRKAASVSGFNYSAALKASSIVWDETTLDKWLTDPDTMVPQNDMSIAVPKAEERRDIIAYLRQAK